MVICILLHYVYILYIGLLYFSQSDILSTNVWKWLVFNLQIVVQLQIENCQFLLSPPFQFLKSFIYQCIISGASVLLTVILIIPQVQHNAQNNHRCGVCGNEYSSPTKSNEPGPGNRFASGMIVAKYQPGQISKSSSLYKKRLIFILLTSKDSF